MAQHSNRGMTSHWVIVWGMIAAFAVGGIGMVFWNWWIVGLGALLFAGGGIYAMATGIMEQVE